MTLLTALACGDGRGFATALALGSASQLRLGVQFGG